ncbi:carboxymuconolactone decarboxylase family protein [Agrobacterium rhizogenes]|nr:carboxymuconolactone decarboxylase family protein [Rhizobium rhizogenes]NTI97036.1 carboxymuconolactone decarboxylase family protein [Rhizobium rhizogenes]NTJ59427.1 carboxymuconolactone decarboxylase family protein [Rhizobium rhizogenes]OCJ29046.1 4-carboxymuconolactone decarboxylase [Agrobacterium sp. B133/95]
MATPTDKHPALSLDDLRSVSPALAAYTQNTVIGDLWSRSGLSARDRSIVTVAALIARNQTIGLRHYVNKALDSGVSAAEVSEIVTHLAFYTGWSNAFFAVEIVKDIFTERGISADQLPEASPQLLPLNEEVETKRATGVQANFGDVSPGVVHYTAEILFKNLWLRPGLAPRDRRLVTVAALVANGQVAQVTYHLGRAMDNGLTQEQASEALTQLAFYSGWPCVFSAMPVVKDVFANRS